MANALLHNRRVLVVEDEYMIAEAMSRNLRRAGAMVLGPVSDVEGALALLAQEADVHAAVLDINLGEHKVYPVVDVLLARGARCVFTTGNDLADVPSAYAELERCEKPVDPTCIIHALTDNSPTGLSGSEARSPDMLALMRGQLLEQIQTANRLGKTLLAAKLCEALDILDEVHRG